VHRTLLQNFNFPLFTHCPYLLNLAKNPEKEDSYWVKATVQELEMASSLHARGAVIHTGNPTIFFLVLSLS
jgi:endonuclease IV